MPPPLHPRVPADPGLNPAHARVIRATFKHVSNLLEQAERVGRGDVGPFDQHQSDVSPEEAGRLAELVVRIHERMLGALEHLDIAGPEPESSARWAIRTALLFSDIALSELSPEALRAYGALGEAEGAAITGVARDLRGLVENAMRVVQDTGSASSAPYPGSVDR